MDASDWRGVKGELTPLPCIYSVKGEFSEMAYQKSKLTQRQIYSTEAQSYPDTQAWIKAVRRHGGIADERGTH